MLVVVKHPAADPLPKLEYDNVEALLDRIRMLREDLTIAEYAEQISALKEDARFEAKARQVAEAACFTLAPSKEQIDLRDQCIEASRQANSAEHRARSAFAKRAADAVPEVASIMMDIGVLLTELADTLQEVEQFTANNSRMPSPQAWRKAKQVRDMATALQAMSYRAKHNFEG